MRLWETAIQFPKCHSIRLEARAEISGPPIRYLTPGSALRLQCRVVQNTEASEYIFWYHDNRMINYDIDRGINVSTEPGKLPPPSPYHDQPTPTTTQSDHAALHSCVAFVFRFPCRLSIIGAYDSAHSSRAFGQFHLRGQQHAAGECIGAYFQR